MNFADYLKVLNKSGLEIIKNAKVGETVGFGAIVFTLTKSDVDLIKKAQVNDEEVADA